MKRNLIFAIIIFFLGVSCRTSYYTPSAHHVPLFQEKGEFSVQSTASTNGLLDAQVAYAITNHIAVMGGAGINRGSLFSFIDYGSGGHLNLAAGYFTPLFSRNTTFSIYGGMERGDYNYGYITLDEIVGVGTWFWHPVYKDNGTAHITFNKFYLMPSVGYTHRIFDIAFSMRMAHLSFPIIENNIIEQDSHDYRYLEGLKDFNNSILFEPALTFRLGWEYFKVQTQIGLSLNAGHHSSGYFEDVYISTGLYFIFAKRYKKNTIPKD